jgi:hypothetical protein
MDLLEDATGEDLAGEFLLWVFPDSYEAVLADRREARVRLGELRSRLTDAALSLDVTTPIEADIRDWSFDAALAALDEAEAGLDTYIELQGELDALADAAAATGLELPASLAEYLQGFEFEELRAQMSLATDAIDAYVDADEAVGAPRNVWERFGLLGSDPEGEVEDARNAFANGDFEESIDQSHNAEDLIADASSVAFRRMLVVAGFFGLLVLALAIALGVSRLRERELAEP